MTTGDSTSGPASSRSRPRARRPPDRSSGRSVPRGDTPIGDHGVIGDLETLALVGGAATVEWLCWPRFDSPSVFGRLLDPDGGHWRIAPTVVDARSVDASGERNGASRVHHETIARRLYLPGTNILVTRYHVTSGADHGIVEIEDCMAIDAPQRMLLRRVTGIRGTVSVDLDLRPRPDYGRAIAEVTPCPAGARIEWRDVGPGLRPDHADRSGPDRADPDVGAVDGDHVLVLTSSVPLGIDDGDVTATFDVSEGDRVVFALGPRELDGDGHDALDATTAFWRSWISRSNYRGRWREVVERSALTLKLLTHRPTGGLIAAGTTGLPETLGGSRNWDYRFVWIRDAAFALYAFIELGFTEEASAFTDWLRQRIVRRDDERARPLTPLYDLDGVNDLPEIELSHWAGYGGSAPVRIGNAASGQLQLDIYGELIDSLYLADRHGSGLTLDAWRDVTYLVDWVCDNWDQPDEGFWEVRNGPHELTMSRLMCWVAVERAIRMATFRGRPADLEKWRAVRDRLHAEIVDRGWSDDLQSFTQTLDGDRLDASLLLMPLMRFVTSNDPRWRSTLERIEQTLTHDVLVERYADDTDGLAGDQGSFSICSFWFVEALARAGQAERARLLFDKLLTYTGPLGLFSETISDAGEQLGNFPQAFTHLALISAAVAIEEALGESAAGVVSGWG